MKCFSSWHRAGYTCRYMNISTVRQHTDVLYLNASVPMCTKPGRCWNHWCVPHLPAFVPYHPMYDTSEAVPPPVVCFCGLATALNFLLIHCSPDHSQDIAPCVIPLMQQGRGKGQGRAARCTGMVGSCRSCKKSPLYGVCIAGVEGTARFQASWHAHAANCSMIYRPSSLPSQMHHQLHSQQDRARC